jgi:hypothetical protein
MAVSIPDAAPSVTTAELRDGELTAGKWVNVGLTPSAVLTPRDLRVTLTGADGALLADSAASKLCQTTRTCAPGKSFGYRLGGVPADADTVTVTVYVLGKKAAADTAHFATGSVEAASTLVVRVPGSGSKR